jgi:glutamate 5-kinase
MYTQRRLQIIESARRVVVKVGTAVLTHANGSLDYDQVASLAEQTHLLRQRGVKVVVVTSGAIGAGMAELGMNTRPTELPLLQAAAAVGQGKVMGAYERSFSGHGYHAAQMLLTREDLDERSRYLNAVNCLNALLELGAVPVVNENDTISVEEIGFLENDALAMLVANLAHADLLIALSSIDGLYENPDDPPERRRVVEVVDGVNEAVHALASSERSARGRGGMEAKLRSAQAATNVGVPVIIANGRLPGALPRIFSGEKLGTLFLPASRKMQSRKRWISLGRRPRGRIVVDDGARRAVVSLGKSLLPSGIVAVEGEFQPGDLVLLGGGGDREFARGLVNYCADDVRRIRGLKTTEIARVLGACPYPEVIHRDNLVVMPGVQPA